MKKGMCIILCLCFMLTCMPAAFAADGDVVINATAYTEDSGAKVVDGAVEIKNMGQYIGFSNVDMTGVKSVSIVADCKIAGGDNGDTYSVKTGSATEGNRIAYIFVHDMDAKDATYSANLDMPINGNVRLYIQSAYGADTNIQIKKIILSKNAVPEPTVVPDSAIIDNYADTWTATDALGRITADYEEVGDVKDGMHEVGMFYWINGNTDGMPKAIATLQSKIIAENPDAKDDYEHPAWPESQGKSGAYYWGEPLFGYYLQNDYFVYRRHAELLANAGVDVILFDWSNGQQVMWNSLTVLTKAFSDAKKDGVNIPKLSCLGPWGGGETFMRALFVSIISDPAYSDMWYRWSDGKAVTFNPSPESKYKPGDNLEANDTMEDILETFMFRGNGFRGTVDVGATGAWNWLQNYPQTKWGTTEDGRVECVPVGTAINHSYVYNYEDNGVFSDPYTKGRAYTEAFGEDYRPIAKNLGYFLREQESRALEADPAIVLVDGWNEWQNGRQKLYSGFENAFVDTFDEENSRDFEPAAGSLRDDYYNALVDFVRKYKGVRPAPIASAEKTIDIFGDVAQWSDVAPTFVNTDGGYERDNLGYVNGETGENFHYTVKLSNVIKNAKVARDSNNFYFMAQCANDVVKGNSFMHLYINTDRNRATGWEGYDYSVNVAGEGALAYCTDGATWVKTSDVSMNVSGKYVTVAIPRSAIGETGLAELEFKWADAADENGDLLRFYQFGSVAPMGRFNYLYTETMQKTLDKNTRAALADTSVFKADCEYMNVNGGKIHVYDPDTTVKTIAENGVLYVPLEAAEDILGYGETKIEYYSDLNMLYVKNHNVDKGVITDYIWSYTSPDSAEVRVNGRVKYLSATAKLINGRVYLPLTYFKDVFGWNIADLGNGAFAVSSHGIDNGAANTALGNL